MAARSAGILLYRVSHGFLEVLIVHPGGPFWKNKDLGAWSIPKGEFRPGDDPLRAAIREFEEEIGQSISGDFIVLKPIKQASGKIVHAFALERDIDVSEINSNTFEVEWPPKSGKRQTFPEVDRAGWSSIEDSKQKLNPSQTAFIDELVERLRPE